MVWSYILVARKCLKHGGNWLGRGRPNFELTKAQILLSTVTVELTTEKFDKCPDIYSAFTETGSTQTMITNQMAETFANWKMKQEKFRWHLNEYSKNNDIEIYYSANWPMLKG